MTANAPDPLIRIELRGSVALVTIDRAAARNAIDHPTLDALQSAFSVLAADQRVAVVVLTGVGDRAFCAGMDLKAFAVEAAEGTNSLALRLADFCQRGLPKPLIAAVNGAALAGGFELALMCDLIVAVPHASFGLPEVRLGLIAAAGGLIRLPRRIPRSIAMEMILTGAPLDVRRAHALGLVNQVVPAASLIDSALELAGEIAVNAPLALGASKVVVRAAEGLTLDEAFALSGDSTDRVFKSDDALEGARSFAERREPLWRGR